MILSLIILLTIYVSSVITMHGGFRISAVRFKFLVSIRYRNQHICGGAILNVYHILTAGHCVHEIFDPALFVAAGIVEQYNKNIQQLQVKDVYIHPDFKAVHHPINSDDIHWENNIAILELREGLMWESNIAPVRLIGAESNWNSCLPCELPGWNVARLPAKISVSAMWTFAAIVQNERCHNFSIHLSEHEKCIFPFGLTIIENQDSGIPLICDDSAVGIVVSAGNDKPSVLLSVYPYLEFIASVIEAEEINIPADEFQFFVSIWYFGKYQCGGSILTTTHILTAGHCVNRMRKTDLRVVAGQSEFSESDRTIEWLSVNHVEIHPAFRENSFSASIVIIQNDIAILTLGVSLAGRANIGPISLGRHLPEGQSCRVYRWSRTSKKGNLLLKSMWSHGMIFSVNTSQKLGAYIGLNQFIVNSLYSLPIAIRGDSGNPLICDGKAVGILFGASPETVFHWGAYYPITFLNIFPYHDFIVKNAPDAIFSF